MAQLIEMLNKFKGKKIIIIGDIMLDRYISGTVERISPEAPIPVVKVEGIKSVLGGAANVANNILALGGKPSIIGIVGNDNEGAELKYLLKNIYDGTKAVQNFQTITKVRVIGAVASPHQLVRYDLENKFEVDENTENRLFAEIEEHISEADAVVLSDYNKGIFSKTLAQRAIMLANRYNKPLIVDPKPENIERFAQAALVCPNFKEAAEIAGYKNPEFSIKMLSNIAGTIQKRFNITFVAITCGKNGIFYYEDKENFGLHPAKVKEVYDVSGAGDTVCAVIALSLAAGANISDACCLANKAGGIVVCKPGTATVSIEEIKEKIDSKM